AYDVRDLLACLLDGNGFDEYRAEYGQTLVCGYGRLGGFAVGVVANQKKTVKRASASGPQRLEFGGVIYPESADKAARFIMDCNQARIPLLFFHDVNGFMVGKEMEAAGIIRSGAKMVNVVANSVVPKFSVVMGGSFGAGNYAMCGRAYDPRLLLAWPTARYAVMGGDQAANTLMEIRARQLERGGHKLDEKERQELLSSIRASYDAQTDPRYGAARLWLDALIDPLETRAWLIAGLEAASLNPEIPPFRTGVLQT
ncbi:MAG TPA: carboxyl transferase domain-containing protein, partial [Terriglobales bacterium]|nr:carboxyl transferase domain-containing protein [Terriglobales bacterium]